MGDNAVLDKTKSFALRIIKLYSHLTENKREFIMSKQLLRSGTSIGANTREALRGHSKADFYYKLNIALKEADESAYWMELLHESNYIDSKLFASIYADCNEIIAILVSITKTQKKKPTPNS